MGRIKGIWEAVLKIDGSEAGKQQVPLSGGGNQRISFKVIADSVGTHVLNIGNLSASLVVEEPENSLAINEPTLTPIEGEAEDISLPAITVSPKPEITVFSLAILLEIMGGAFLLIAVTVSIILLRRRSVINEINN